jgi:hypothetical protein
VKADLDDLAFDKVREGSLLQYDCSPSLEDDFRFRGVRVRGPKRVLFGPRTRNPATGTFARVMLCGSYHLESNYLGLRERFLPRIFLVAVDASSHRVFTGHLGGLADAESPRGSSLSDADMKGRSVIEFFNPNLADVLPLPEEEADYLAYVTLGDFVSNVVRIEVRRYDTPEGS